MVWANEAVSRDKKSTVAREANNGALAQTWSKKRYSPRCRRCTCAGSVVPARTAFGGSTGTSSEGQAVASWSYSQVKSLYRRVISALMVSPIRLTNTASGDATGVAGFAGLPSAGGAEASPAAAFAVFPVKPSGSGFCASGNSGWFLDCERGGILHKDAAWMGSGNCKRVTRRINAEHGHLNAQHLPQQ